MKNNEIKDDTISNIETSNKKTYEFIIKVKIIHGEKYDYSNVVYVNAKTKVDIKCIHHGLFSQTPDKHLRGSGCPKCLGKNKTTEDFIIEAIKVHGYKYDYTDLKYENAKTKVNIKCKDHGLYSQIPGNHLKGCGCPKCRDLVTANKRRKTTEEFISKAIKVHGDKYDYTQVKYENSTSKININCKDHGLFLQIPDKHLSGQGCPKCIGRNKTTDEFISEAIKIHGDKYDYTDVLYLNATTKVDIKCKHHGLFSQTPDKHLGGSGCTKCGILVRTNKLTKTKEEFINQAIKIHGYKYNYSEVIYENSDSKINIKCKGHGLFLQTPASHLNGSGCPKCGILDNANKRRKTNDEFINEAIKVHGDKYDYTEVKYVNSDSKINIKCKEHGLFSQIPYSHLIGRGCPKCIGRNKTTDEFISEAIKIHGDKYDYTDVLYLNATTKVDIKCKHHGLFSQTPDTHLGGSGCTKCGYLVTANKLRKSKDEFICEAIKIHGDIYDYTEVKYLGANTNIDIRCKDHGLFIQTPSSHLNNRSGCPKCVGRNKTTEEFISEAMKVHGDKYDYTDLIYENSKTKVNIKCKYHGLFSQNPSNHLKGCGCPNCSNWKSENTMNEILKEIYSENTFKKIKPLWLKYINGYNLEIDAYCEELKIGFEYQGAQHEKFIPYFHNNNIENFYDQQKRDIWKKEKCKELDIKLICIPSNYSYQNKEEMKQFIEQSLL